MPPRDLTHGNRPTDHGDINQTITASLDRSEKGSIELQLIYQFPDQVTGFEVAVSSSFNASEAEGFRSEGNQLVWDGSTGSASITGTLNVSAGPTGASGFIDRGEWAIAQRPHLSYSYKYRQTEPTVKTDYSVEGRGVVSSDGGVMYLGPFEEHSEEENGQRFRLIIPEDASLREHPDAILRSLEYASEELDVGGKDQSVIAIVAPTNVRWSSLGQQSGANGFWARDQCRLDNVNNTWIHEYVHTRQGWESSASARWLTEATAEYYAALLTYQQGRIQFSKFKDYLSTSRDSRSILVDPEKWTRGQAEYTKGRRVLAALDIEIGRETEFNRSFQDVFRKLNGVEGTVSHKSLEDSVVDVAGEALADWLDSYVCGSDVPDIPGEEPDFYKTSPEASPVEQPREPKPVQVPEFTEDINACPVCNSEIDEGDEFCENCGQAFNAVCPVCGVEVFGVLYCPECGSTLEEDCPVCGATRTGGDPFCRKCGHAFSD